VYTRSNTLVTLVVLVVLWAGVVYLLPDQSAMHNLLAGFVGLAGGMLIKAPEA